MSPVYEYCVDKLVRFQKWLFFFVKVRIAWFDVVTMLSPKRKLKINEKQVFSDRKYWFIEFAYLSQINETEIDMIVNDCYILDNALALV